MLDQLPDGATGVLAGLVLVALAAAFAVRRLADARRARGFRAAGERLGLDYDPGGEPDPHLLEQGFALTGHPGAGSVEHRLVGALAGARDAEVTLFDYVTRGSHREGGVRRTVARVRSMRLALPALAIHPAGAEPPDPAGARPGIDLATSAAFAGERVVRAADPAAARTLADAPLVAILDAHPALSVEGRGSTLVVYREDAALAPESLDELLDAARRLAGHLADRSPAPPAGGRGSG